MPKRPDSVIRARAKYEERQSHLPSFVCPICKLKIKLQSSGNLDALSKMTPQESKRYLKLAHIRHKHTNYEKHLRSIMAWKKEMLTELEKKQAEVIKEFRLCAERINEKFSQARLELQEHYKEESKKMLKACPKVVFKPLTKAKKKKARAERKKAMLNEKGEFGFESWEAKKKKRRKKKSKKKTKQKEKPKKRKYRRIF